MATGCGLPLGLAVKSAPLADEFVPRLKTISTHTPSTSVVVARGQRGAFQTVLREAFCTGVPNRLRLSPREGEWIEGSAQSDGKPEDDRWMQEEQKRDFWRLMLQD